MNKNWTVLGGWAAPPSMLKPIFGDSSTYIDINKIMPNLFNNDILIPDWKEHLYKLLQGQFFEPLYLAGWSTGALAVLSILPFVTAKKIVLISATPSFCRKENFRFGTRVSVLQSMIKSLKTDTNQVLKQFFTECGIDWPNINNIYTLEELLAGLHFLDQVSFFSPLPYSSKPLFFHGTDDKIIPVNAGKYVCEHMSGIWHAFTGPHAIFNTNQLAIKTIIDTTFGKD
jgi:hypothetical protein